MEPRKLTQVPSGAQDEREWELADEELDRTAPELGPSTSRPCVCQAVCHCR